MGEKDSLHWADQMARAIVEREQYESQLKEIVKKHGYLVYDEKTPSGKIHIGSGRGWVIHDAIAKALRDIGVKARFVLSSDDMDPYDKPNKDLPESFNQYLGVPFRNIPSPVKGYDSFADYYFKQVTDKFKDFGIECDFESTGERYIKGDFNKTIKKVLDNFEKIQEIYERFYGEKPNTLFFNPICEKCGKIATTWAYEWDEEKELVKYKCEKHHVKWVEGCGHDGEISPYNGNGKLPWKVEWAAKWPTVGVACELAGKDHFTHGGSRSVAIAVADEVLDFPPPYPSTRKKIGKGYEFFTVGGRKMSTSKGAGMGFAESIEYAPAHILRYLLISTRPHAVIDFDPVNKNDLILLHERFDKTERIYFGKEEASESEAKKHKRIYELSHIGKIPSKMPIQISFSFAAIIIQVALDIDKAIDLLKKLGHIPKDVEKKDLKELIERIKFAQNWVNNFAPEQYVFKINDKVPEDVKAKIENKQLECLFKLKAYLKEHKKVDEKVLYDEFYNISRSVDVNPGEFFKAAYYVLIGKEKGPKLANFIVTIGQDKVIELIEQL